VVVGQVTGAIKKSVFGSGTVRIGH
jgi:hypothetical protein